MCAYIPPNDAASSANAAPNESGFTFYRRFVFYFLHLVRGGKQQVVNTIQILIAEKTDLDLPLPLAAQLNDSDLSAECSS